MINIFFQINADKMGKITVSKSVLKYQFKCNDNKKAHMILLSS